MIPMETVYKTIDVFVENLGTTTDHEEQFKLETAAFQFLAMVSPNSQTYHNYKSHYMDLARVSEKPHPF